MRRLLLVAGLLASAGCYETPHPTCAFLCGSDNSCPASYFCAADGWCKLDGTPESFVCDPTGVDAAVNDAAIDAPVVDAAEIDAPDVDAAVDAPVDADTDGPVDADVDASAAMLQILTGTPLAFGNVTETQSTTRAVMVRNGGGSPTSPITVTVSGASFSLVTGVSDTCSGQTLAPSTNCQFDVRYAPAGVGASGGMAMAMASSGGTASINLTGTGTAMLTASPSPAAFGNVTTGMMTSLPVTITNTGSVTSGTITTTAPTGAFSITSDTCDGMTVLASDTCTVTVQFAPSATGAQSSMFTLAATPGGPRTVMLTGTGQ